MQCSTCSCWCAARACEAEAVSSSMRCAASKALLASSTLSAAPVTQFTPRAVIQPPAGPGTTRCCRRSGATKLEAHHRGSSVSS